MLCLQKVEGVHLCSPECITDNYEQVIHLIIVIKPAGALDQQREPQKKRSWSDREKQAVVRHLGGYLRSRKVPGKAPIMKAFNAEPVTFANRSWKNVKDFVRHHISKKDPVGFLKS